MTGAFSTAWGVVKDAQSDDEIEDEKFFNAPDGAVRDEEGNFNHQHLLDENERLKSEVEHHKKMYCVDCGACGDNDSYADCSCEGVEGR